ncbi:MAG TPA: hypothetical protein VMD59_21925, partial [Acidimicrobiales bacterium]|nr:hypothetical protein [Acidimicrobiales bacterium]
DLVTATSSGDPDFGSSSGNLSVTVQPSPAVPEVPWAPLLPSVVAAAGGVALWHRRRRQARSTAKA